MMSVNLEFKRVLVFGNKHTYQPGRVTLETNLAESVSNLRHRKKGLSLITMPLGSKISRLILFQC